MFRLIRLVVLAVLAFAVAMWIANRAEAAHTPATTQSSLTTEDSFHDHRSPHLHHQARSHR